MRRLILEEPVSKTAIWSRRLTVFALAVAGIDLALARGGLDTTAVFSVLGAAMMLACAGLLAAGAAAVIIWRTGRRGAGIAGVAVLLALALLAYPGYLAVEAIRLPVLADVSTDIVDPPAFALSRKALDARHGTTPPNVPLNDREAQRRAYPDVQPILLDRDADDAYPAVLAAVAANGWQLVEATPPSQRMGAGHVDAIARSAIFRMPYDITIRLRPLAGQTRVDIRSVSRVGRHDFGGDAAQIQKFAAALQDVDSN